MYPPDRPIYYKRDKTAERTWHLPVFGKHIGAIVQYIIHSSALADAAHMCHLYGEVKRSHSKPMWLCVVMTLMISTFSSSSSWWRWRWRHGITTWLRHLEPVSVLDWLKSTTTVNGFVTVDKTTHSFCSVVLCIQARYISIHQMPIVPIIPIVTIYGHVMWQYQS